MRSQTQRPATLSAGRHPRARLVHLRLHGHYAEAEELTTKLARGECVHLDGPTQLHYNHIGFGGASRSHLTPAELSAVREIAASA